MKQRLDDDNYAVFGTTSEGYEFSMTLTYKPNAPDGSQPIRITGSYNAHDGFDRFEVNDVNNIPAVITEGEW